jgi:hypothetical protein
VQRATPHPRIDDVERQADQQQHRSPNQVIVLHIAVEDEGAYGEPRHAAARWAAGQLPNSPKIKDDQPSVAIAR